MKTKVKTPFALWVQSVGGDHDAAKLLGINSRTIHRWRRGEFIPQPSYIYLINKLTKGAIGPMDFYNKDKLL